MFSQPHFVQLCGKTPAVITLLVYAWILGLGRPQAGRELFSISENSLAIQEVFSTLQPLVLVQSRIVHSHGWPLVVFIILYSPIVFSLIRV